MSTIIIITPPPKQQQLQQETTEQLVEDAKNLEKAGFKVQVFQSEK